MVKVMACVQHYRSSKGIVACLALVMLMLVCGVHPVIFQLTQNIEHPQTQKQLKKNCLGSHRSAGARALKSKIGVVAVAWIRAGTDPMSVPGWRQR